MSDTQTPFHDENDASGGLFDLRYLIGGAVHLLRPAALRRELLREPREVRRHRHEPVARAEHAGARPVLPRLGAVAPAAVGGAVRPRRRRGRRRPGAALTRSADPSRAGPAGRAPVGAPAPDPGAAGGPWHVQIARRPECRLTAHRRAGRVGSCARSSYSDGAPAEVLVTAPSARPLACPTSGRGVFSSPGAVASGGRPGRGTQRGTRPERGPHVRPPPRPRSPQRRPRHG